MILESGTMGVNRPVDNPAAGYGTGVADDEAFCMARVLGQSGRYVSQQAVKGFRTMLVVTLCTVCVLSVSSGLLIGLSIRSARFSPWFSLTASVILLLVVIVVSRWSSRKLQTLEKQRMDMRRGATGETAVAVTLGDFPDNFYVIHDVTTPCGNLDHVVVGPTGVFVIDTKNWRGAVTADGKGELLLNGQPTDKPFVKSFVARIMGVKERVRVLAPRLDPYFQAVFVFTSARVNANWGTTGSVHCLRDEQLYEYIVEKSFGRKLDVREAERISRAFLGLAQMDTGFDSNVSSATPKMTRKPRLAAASVQQAG
jgi:hypothetical protein